MPDKISYRIRHIRDMDFLVYQLNTPSFGAILNIVSAMYQSPAFRKNTDFIEIVLCVEE